MSFNKEGVGPAEQQLSPSLSVFPPIPLTCQGEILADLPVVTEPIPIYRVAPTS